MKAIEQYFRAVLFTMLYKVALAFESVGEILTYDQVKATRSSTFLWYCYYAVQSGSNLSLWIEPKLYM